jgi:adenosylcobinamide-phosphate synthase
MSVPVALIAIIAERLMGYPPSLQQKLGHPVQWIGAIIGFLDKVLNNPNWTTSRRRQTGVVALGVVLLLTAFLSFGVATLLRAFPFGWIGEAFVASVFLAQTQLGNMVREVAHGLRQSLSAGRRAVNHIVGRDVTQLDKAEVSRAAIETLAENASDGVIAPLFWLMLLGLPGVAVYKAINTADSMIGHLDERYKDFGWASAKCDDVVNWIPARITGLLFAFAALFQHDASASIGFDTMMRDARKHRSPNAGWPEAAMAGALGLGLGGPRAYRGKMVDLPQMGQGRRELNALDIERALVLYWRALSIAAVIVLCLWGMLLMLG